MKIQPCLLLLGLALVVASCSVQERQGQAEPRTDENRSQVNEESAAELSEESPAEFARRLGADQPHEEYGIKCSPKEIGPDDVIRLEFTGKHGPQAEIFSPSARAYFIAYPKEELIEFPPPIDGERLSQMRILTLPVREIKGLRRAEIVPVFKEDGVYTLFVGTVLEVDLEDKEIDAYCHFIFSSGKKRP